MIYMNYELYLRLYGEAKSYTDVDMYIAERGFQGWMEPYTETEVGDILRTIFNISGMAFKELREAIGLSRIQFSRSYNIPIRSLENWDSGTREAPEYVLALVSYTIFLSALNGGSTHEQD